jgi:Trypsin-co-occurring domain 2
MRAVPEVPEVVGVKVLQEGLGLGDAITMLRDELLQAQEAGANADIQLPISSMTVQLAVHATREVDGKAGFRVPVINVELGAGASLGHGSEHTVTVVFDGPVDRNGNPVKVASSSDQRRG